MKKIIFVMVICMLSVTAKTVTKNEDIQKETGLAKKKCNNLICIFDAIPAESLSGDNHAMGYSLMYALQEKVAPIIVTKNIMEHVCYWGTHRLEVIRNNFFGDYWKRRFMSLVMGTGLDGWECYVHKGLGLVLLIPQKYIETHSTMRSSQAEDPITQCGFNIENLEKIKDVSCSTILEYIQKHTPAYDYVVDDFESMFIKNADQVEQAPTWNIFVTGHGGPVGGDRC